MSMMQKTDDESDDSRHPSAFTTREVLRSVADHNAEAINYLMIDNAPVSGGDDGSSNNNNNADSTTTSTTKSAVRCIKKALNLIKGHLDHYYSSSSGGGGFGIIGNTTAGRGGGGGCGGLLEGIPIPSLRQDNHTTNGFYIQNHVLLVNLERITGGIEGGGRGGGGISDLTEVSNILLFNLGLCHHLEGMKQLVETTGAARNNNNNNSLRLLDRACRIYQQCAASVYCHHFQSRQQQQQRTTNNKNHVVVENKHGTGGAAAMMIARSSSSSSSSRRSLLLAYFCLNNIAQIHYHLSMMRTDPAQEEDDNANATSNDDDDAMNHLYHQTLALQFLESIPPTELLDAIRHYNRHHHHQGDQGDDDDHACASSSLTGIWMNRLFIPLIMSATARARQQEGLPPSEEPEGPTTAQPTAE